ncbi:hypothetical protein AJ79_04076 [Helicocarpus griseus UAMH5409]|uniref:Uncharacterized protein n=1 Tax=Helicocarpus griseus UAMH5409 TaxID=1447875 RepID=A0A2B7XU37_9EURO|nr:hypothetical protein AJ79_04076 [Helicocarpus griseus UAMH5409]
MHAALRGQGRSNAGPKTTCPIHQWLQDTAGGEPDSTGPDRGRIDHSPFYKERYDSAVYTSRPPSPADSGIEIVDWSPPPSAFGDSIPVPISVLEARRNAKRVLSNCRVNLLSRELTRMRKSRIGLGNWTTFWYRVYHHDLAKTICGTIIYTAPKIDKIFKSIAKALFDLSYRIGEDIERATTEEQIVRCWQFMENETLVLCKLREQYVTELLENLRVCIEKIPVDISDDMYDDLKRAVFAVDPWGNYHLGDKEKEERDLNTHIRPDPRMYIQADPDLITRPGFSGQFQNQLEQATVQEIAQEMGYGVIELESCHSNESATTGESVEEDATEELPPDDAVIMENIPFEGDSSEDLISEEEEVYAQEVCEVSNEELSDEDIEIIT